MKIKLLLFILILPLSLFAQNKEAAKVPASNEQTLEVRNLLLTVQAKTSEARALKAEAAIAEAEAARLEKEVKPMLEKIAKKLGLNETKYTATIEEGKLVFVLKPEPKPAETTPKP